MIYRILLFIAIASSCDSDEKSAMDVVVEPAFEINQIAALDNSITESSGIITIDGSLYTHSDIRGTAQLIQINLDGTIEGTNNFENIQIRDWEDIATDDDFLYIGDIGNNLGNKTDLKIFKIAKTAIEDSNPNIETISFSFADQTNFDNTELNQTSYDVEALTSLDNSLYIFTKDWLELNSNVYRIDPIAGTQALSPLAKLNIGGLVTGATTSPEGDIIICGYSPTLSPFVARIKFENGLPTVERKIDITGMLGANSQIEGITYAGKTNGIPTYYLSSEQFSRNIAGTQITFPANLYELKWNE